MQLWLGYLFLSSLQIPPLFTEVPLPSRKACDHVFVCWWYLFLRFSYPTVIFFIFFFFINRISCQFFLFCLSSFCVLCPMLLVSVHYPYFINFSVFFNIYFNSPVFPLLINLVLLFILQLTKVLKFHMHPTKIPRVNEWVTAPVMDRCVETQAQDNGVSLVVNDITTPSPVCPYYFFQICCRLFPNIRKQCVVLYLLLYFMYISVVY